MGTPFTIPGGAVDVYGSGCPANAQVELRLDGESIGETTAIDDGTFSATLDVPQVALGRRSIDAACGGAVATTSVDLVQTSSTRPQGQSGMVLVFFVLVGAAIVHGREQASPAGAPSPNGAPPERNAP